MGGWDLISGPAHSPPGPARSEGPAVNAGGWITLQRRVGPMEGECCMARVSLNVNGVQYTEEVEPRLLLVLLIRDRLGLTGTHVGCDTSSCGACTLHLDGQAVKSCTVLAVQADGSEITTIEGLANGAQLHPMQ